MILTTLDELRKSPIAKTDVGELIALNGLPQIEFLVKGKIKKQRAGLFFLDIENQQFTCPKNSNFKEGEDIICVIKAEVNSENVDINNNNAIFTIKGLEKLN